MPAFLTWYRNLCDRSADLIEEIILKSRYLLVPFYLVLLFDILTIMIDFIKMMVGTIETAILMQHTLQALELLDITMMANLIWLISAGSYYVFVDNSYPDRLRFRRPRCLTHVSAGILKEKMAGSIVGISSVYLLELFMHLAIANEEIRWEQMGGLLALHLVFILGYLAFNRANGADHHMHDDALKEKEHAGEVSH
jgi:uncharacterized protein (TIGR00645 family)